MEPATPARSRLAYDELLANQLALGLVRNAARNKDAHEVSGDLADRVKSALPFSLTASQVRAWRRSGGYGIRWPHIACCRAMGNGKTVGR